MRRHRSVHVVLAILVLTILAGCGFWETTTRETQSSATLVRTLRPTFTPTNMPVSTEHSPATATPTSQSTLEPTETEARAKVQTATATPTILQAQAIVENQQLNVRSGPSTEYPIIGQAKPSDRFRIIGKAPGGNWWQIDYVGRDGWVAAALVSVIGDVDSVQTISGIPTLLPTTMENSPTSSPTPTQTPSPTPWPDSLYAYQVGSMITAPNCEDVVVSGKVVDASGSLIDGVMVELRYTNDSVVFSQTGQGMPTGEWRFTPLPREFIGFPTSFTVRLVESQANPTALSNVHFIDYRDCNVAGQFTNIVFRKN